MRAQPAGSPLEPFVRRAIWRVRLERLRRTLTVLVWIFLAIAALWMAATAWQPELAAGVPVALIIAGGVLLLAIDAALFWRVDERQIMRRLDRQLALSDAVVSAEELGTDTAEEWRRRQLEQTVAEFSRRSWDQLWPRTWGRYTGLAAVTLLAVAAALLTCARLLPKAQASLTVNPFTQSQLVGVEQMFQDWEDAAKETKDPELQRMLEELRPLREKMARQTATEKDVLVALSRMEAKLEEMRKSLQGDSLASSAPELANALEPFGGMSPLSAALRRKDFAEAEKAAREAAQKLAQPDAKNPDGAQNAENQARMERTAKAMEERGQKSASEAVRQMSQGMKEGNKKQTSEGLKSLGQCMAGQAKKDGEKQRLARQLSQLGQCKDCLGSGQSVCRGMSLVPKLSTMKMPGGKGAGSDTDLDRFGGETQLASQRTAEQLTGEQGEGDSQTTTEKDNQKTRETATGARKVGFQQYEKMSRAAIEDESIPLGHRQAIRKYFELIRPEQK